MTNAMIWTFLNDKVGNDLTDMIMEYSSPYRDLFEKVMFQFHNPGTLLMCVNAYCITNADIVGRNIKVKGNYIETLKYTWTNTCKDLELMFAHCGLYFNVLFKNKGNEELIDVNGDQKFSISKGCTFKKMGRGCPFYFTTDNRGYYFSWRLYEVHSKSPISITNGTYESDWDSRINYI